MIDELLNSGRPWAEERGKRLREYQDAFAQGQISETEYRDLLEDLIRVDEIRGDATDMKLKAYLISAVQFALRLV